MTRSASLFPDLDDIITHTPDIWENLRDARLLITGGTGFFGAWLLQSFAHANRKFGLNAQALVLTRDPAKVREKTPELAALEGVTFHPGDVRTFDFPAGRFDAVIHAATPASASLVEDNPLLMLDTTVEGTRRVLDFAVQAGAKRLLFTSSGAIYGRQPPDCSHIPEDHPGAPDPLNPRSAYAEGKRLGEHLCAVVSHQHGLHVSIARCFAFVGPYLPLDIHYAIGNFLRDGLRGGPIEVGGDGTPYRSYLYAADLTAWLWTILMKGQSCRPYNVGSDRALTIRELAEKTAAFFGTEVRIAKTPDPARAPERYVPATSRAASELGLKAWTDLDQALAKTAAWHRAG